MQAPNLHHRVWWEGRPRVPDEFWATELTNFEIVLLLDQLYETIYFFLLFKLLLVGVSVVYILKDRVVYLSLASGARGYEFLTVTHLGTNKIKLRPLNYSFNIVFSQIHIIWIDSS